jgi:lysozyme
MQEPYISAIKRFEGYAPRAQWDYKQYSGGYGTRAEPGESFTPEKADQRLREEVAKANGYVKGVGAKYPPGWEEALTSLTYNAGTEWINSGLGDAVRSGDWNRAQQLFGQYNRAGGKFNEGLANRRAQELAWITGDVPKSTATPTVNAPSSSPWPELPVEDEAEAASPFGKAAASALASLGDDAQTYQPPPAPHIASPVFLGSPGNSLSLAKSATPYRRESQMANLGSKPRGFADGGAAKKKGKAGTQSGKTFESSAHEELGLRPQETSDSVFRNSIGNFGKQAALTVPGLYNGYAAVKEAMQPEPDWGEVATNAMYGLGEVGATALGGLAASNILKYGQPFASKWETIPIAGMGAAPAGIAPSPRTINSALNGPPDAGRLERGYDYLRQAGRGYDPKAHRAAVEGAPSAKLSPPADDVSRFYKTFEGHAAAPKAMEKIEAPGGYAETAFGRRHGMDIDAAGILNTWKPPVGALPHADGGRVGQWSKQARQMSELPDKFWTYNPQRNELSYADSDYIRRRDRDRYNEHLRLWREDDMVPGPFGADDTEQYHHDLPPTPKMLYPSDDPIPEKPSFENGIPHYFAAGGPVDGAHTNPGNFSGAIKHRGRGGRTDDRPLDVEPGSYVFPADFVSALGQGSSDAGHRVIEKMFPKKKYGKSQPIRKQFADGGAVPIIAAVDEHILSPDQFAHLGNGDLEFAHQVLDQLVKRVRNDNINTLKTLPPPAK